MNQAMLDNPCLVVRELVPFTFSGAACFHCGKMPESRPRTSQRTSIPSLKSCAACRSAFFCDKVCQRASWNKYGHKKDCKLIRSLDRTVSCAQKCHRSTPAEQWFEKCKLLLQQGAQLTDTPVTKSHLMHYITEQAHCVECNVTRAEAELFPCPACHLDFRCALHLLQADENHTEEQCQLFQMSARCAMFSVNHIRKYKDTFDYIPDAPKTKMIKKEEKNKRNFNHARLPTSGWKEYFVNRMGDQMIGLPPEFLLQTTYHASQALTTALAMEHFFIDRPELNKDGIQSTFVIHIVGANVSYEIPPTPVWEEIPHLFPSIQKFHVIFIGPDVHWNGALIEVDNCPDCVEKRRKRFCGIVRSTYEDYFNGLADKHSFMKPDLVMMFNSGVHEHGEYGPWRGALDVILDEGFPMCSTSYSLNEANLDMEIWNSVDANVTMGPTANPYRCLVPRIDFTSNDDVYYPNYYYTCVQGCRAVTN